MMTKTLALLALAALALTVTPTVSACQYVGPAGETVNYVLPCAGFQAGHDTVTLAEAVAAAVVDFVTGIPLP